MDSLLEEYAVRIVHDGRPLDGRVELPGSKSITNRALLLAGLARGTSTLSGVLRSDDTRYMSDALRQMGVEIVDTGPTTLRVTGRGGLQAPMRPLYLGNAGTATRFLTAAATLVNGSVTITGDEHMQKRPIEPLVAALNRLGVKASTASGCPPVLVQGSGGFSAREINIDGALSSQYVSAILMLAPWACESLKVTIEGGAIGARGYVDLTLACMEAFGARVRADTEISWLVSHSPCQPCDFSIEPDASAATYLWAAAAMTDGTIDLGTTPTGMTQPDARAHEIIRRFPDLPMRIDGSQMQDAVPTLAVLAAFSRRPVRFTGIENLRVKECDRTRALATELSKIEPGLAVEEGDDLIVNTLPGVAKRREGRGEVTPLDTYDDHRIAMSLALAGLMTGGIVIKNPGCVAKTYPNFWHDLTTLGVNVDPMPVADANGEPRN